jgi:hypothetical protein
MKNVFLLALLLGSLGVKAQSLYFPPTSSSATWDTLSPASLGWCTDKIDSLYQFLDVENSKAFIVLKDGKIVLEKYFGTFTQDSSWYWASAGKTITSFLIGKAQEEAYLKLSDTSSKYLGTGWTSATAAQEGKITVRHQLTMTSGLDDGVPDNHCTTASCLQYLKDAGTRWAYHNAPYTLLEKVIENATGQTLNSYTQNKLKLKTGITGAWFKMDFDNVFFSKARSMARFGLLIQNKGIWNKDTLLYDTAYFRQMISSSQSLNLSYGYLWWLNGKASYMLPTTQFVFSGNLLTAAKSDVHAAIGKNGQIISIAPSQGLVWVRMGESTSSSEVSTTLCNRIWEELNKVLCASTSAGNNFQSTSGLQIFPNPVANNCTVILANQVFSVTITDMLGKVLYHIDDVKGNANIDTKSFSNGVYLCFVKSVDGGTQTRKLIVAH